MARADPVFMAVWMHRELPASVRAELSGPFFRMWASATPGPAAAHLFDELSLPDLDRRAAAESLDLFGQVAALWAAGDAAGAVDWMITLPSGAAKQRALEQVCYRWTERDPEAAAAFVGREGNAVAAATVAGKWAEEDPWAAARWASALPSGRARLQACEAVVGMWADQDRVAATRFAAQTGITLAHE